MSNSNSPQQPPFNATFMGVVVGAANHYGTSFSPKDYYCESGFAFALNVAPDLCPSGPYCWNHKAVLENLRQLGLEISYIPLDGKTVIDDALCAVGEAVLSVEALEHQLVSNSDEEGLVLSMPWGPDGAACLKRVEFQDLQEIKPPIFGFYRIDRSNPAQKHVRVLRGLECALRMYDDSVDFQMDGYRFGPSGFEVWADALHSHKYDTHGNWWNAQVWSECRHVASEYFKNWELVACDETSSLAQTFSEVSSLLVKAGAHELDNDKKRTLVQRAAEVESRTPNLLRSLVGKLRNKYTVG